MPNGAVHSGCTDATQATAFLVIFVVSRIEQNEQYWEQQFCQMERDILVLPTEITGPVKVDRPQSWSRIFWSDQTEMIRSI